MLASFAWHFPAPGFPTAHKQWLFSSMFKSFSLALPPQEIAGLKKAIEAVSEVPDFQRWRNVLRHLADHVHTVRSRASHFAAALGSELQTAYAQEGVSLKDEPLAVLFLDQRLPNLNEGAWEAVRLKDSIERGWLLPRIRDVDWAKRAAEQLLRRWQHQMNIPIDAAHKKKMNEFLVQELMQ